MRPRWRRFVLRLVLMALLWLALNGADGKSWIVGAPIVVLAAAVNFPFLPRGAWRWKLRGILPMLWFFVKESYLGAYDVAHRAFTMNSIFKRPFSMTGVISEDRESCQSLFCLMKNPPLYRSARPESGRAARERFRRAALVRPPSERRRRDLIADLAAALERACGGRRDQRC